MIGGAMTVGALLMLAILGFMVWLILRQARDESSRTVESSKTVGESQSVQPKAAHATTTKLQKKWWRDGRMVFVGIVLLLILGLVYGPNLKEATEAAVQGAATSEGFRGVTGQEAMAFVIFPAAAFFLVFFVSNNHYGKPIPALVGAVVVFLALLGWMHPEYFPNVVEPLIKNGPTVPTKVEAVPEWFLWATGLGALFLLLCGRVLESLTALAIFLFFLINFTAL